MLSLFQKRSFLVARAASARPFQTTPMRMSLLLPRSAAAAGGRSSISRRTYIFLPDSWSETKHLLQEAWNTESQVERRAIFVKLLSRRKNNMNATAITDSSILTAARRTPATPKKRLIVKRKRGFSYYSPTAWKRRLALYYHNKRAATSSKRRARAEQVTVAAASSTMTTPTDPSLPRRQQHSIIRAAGDYLHRHSKNTRAKWKYIIRRRIYIKEPFEKDWFDSNGFPLTSQTPFQRYVNPWNSISTNGMQSLLLFMRWRMERLYKWVFQKERSSKERMIDSSNASTERQEPLSTTTNKDDDDTPTKLQLTWIGHSTCLVEFLQDNHTNKSSFTILTDPHFSPRASPIQMWPFGVKRAVEPALSISELPTTIDVILLSHDHYDHLDQDSIINLKSRVSLFAVPKGIKDWLMDYCDVNKDNIVELEWWESVKINKSGDSGRRAMVATDDNTTTTANDDSSFLTLTCAPAQHWCGRTLFDRNKRLWCSWAVSLPSCSFYFGGDTGFPTDFPLFQQIGDRLGPFDLCALPIGAYAPRYFMKPSHVHPCEAVTMHQQLRSKRSVGIHHDTFQLADEDMKEPARLLQEAVMNSSSSSSGVNFCTLPHGGVLRVPAEEKEVAVATVVVKHEAHANKDEQDDDTTDNNDHDRAYG